MQANNRPVDIAVALSPCNLEVVPGLIEEISSLGTLGSFSDDSRLKLLASARSLVRALETPRETMFKHCWAEITTHSALTIGVSNGLWNLMAKENAPEKVADLANALGVEADLLGRLTRHVAAMGYLIEIGPDQYKSTNFTKSLSIPIFGDTYPCMSDTIFGPLRKLYKYLRITGYKTPASATDGPFQFGNDTTKSFFDFLALNPGLGSQFNHAMGGYRQGRPSWMDPNFFPVEERLVKGFDKSNDAVMLVDIGGSVGHDLEEFLRKHPSCPGRLILQDLPEVTNQAAELNKRIERMSYNFCTRQPIEGARAYYLHSILHDWSDEECLQILGNIKEAMKHGYSRLLINENVIPETNAHWEATALDITMATVLSAKERTRPNWDSLLAKAGLHIWKVWNVKNHSEAESLIECELPRVVTETSGR